MQLAIGVDQITDRHHPRLEEASVQRPASPSGIAPAKLGRQLRWEGQELEQQRIPVILSADAYLREEN